MGVGVYTIHGKTVSHLTGGSGTIPVGMNVVVCVGILPVKWDLALSIISAGSHQGFD